METFYDKTLGKSQTRAYLEKMREEIITDDNYHWSLYKMFDPSVSIGISFKSWEQNLSIILRGNLSEQTEFVWKVYTEENIMSREMIGAKLNRALSRSRETDPDISLSEENGPLLEILMQKLDVDRDGKVSFADFKECVKNDSLLLECLGQCLPTPQATAAFLLTINGQQANMKIKPC